MMEMWGEWLPWIVGIAIVSALLNRSRGRRYRRRGHRSARRGRAPRRHGQGPRFPREALPGRIVRITDGDGLVAEVAGFGRLNIRLAHMDAPRIRPALGGRSKTRAQATIAPGRVSVSPACARPLRPRRRGGARWRRDAQRRTRAPGPRVGVCPLRALASAPPVQRTGARSSTGEDRVVGVKRRARFPHGNGEGGRRPDCWGGCGSSCAASFTFSLGDLWP